MIVPDANLLLYAYDESFPDHAAARSWWESRRSEPADHRVRAVAIVRIRMIESEMQTEQ